MLAHVKVLLSGGCQLQFGDRTSFDLDNVVAEGTSVGGLVLLLRDRYIQERPELFLDPSMAHLRPGILVLVNGCDAEVLGGTEYLIQNGDEVEFVSTLHGG